MNQGKLYQWVRKVSKSWQGTTRHFRENVVVFSRGIARAQSCQIRRIAGCVAGRTDSQRRRLQRFVKNEMAMDVFYREWSRSVVKALKVRHLTLIVDETKLKAQFGAMVVGVAFEGRCIPLAWRIYRANDSASYPQEGQVAMILSLLQAVQAGLPRQVKVRVLADRGIGTSPELMRGIMALGWTFLFRVTKQSKLILPDGEEVTFYEQVTQAGDHYDAQGLVFKKRGRIPAHVRVVWGSTAKEQWALVTNDPTLTGWEYAQRMWIEEAFRDLKSHGWQLEDAQFTCPKRMERLWILLVVTYCWLLLWGQAIVNAGAGVATHKRADGSHVRRWSLFREGWFAFLAQPPPRKT